MQKTIVVFANSVKKHQHCVAGKDVLTKEWVRPVSNLEEKELTSQQCICEGYHEPVKILQQINIEFLKHDSLINQPENYLISNKKWLLLKSITRESVYDYLDHPDNLWINSRDIKNDRVDYNLIQSKKIAITQSLYLIEVEKIYIYWKDRSDIEQNPQRRAKFKYNNIEYDLALTDPNFENYSSQYIYKKNLCISLSSEFKGFCYKIIASIF